MPHTNDEFKKLDDLLRKIQDRAAQLKDKQIVDDAELAIAMLVNLAVFAGRPSE
jgi:hypothetical protein